MLQNISSNARRLVTVVLLIVVLISLLLAIGVRLIIDADFIQSRLEEALSTPRAGLSYRVRIGSVQLGLFSRSVELQNSVLISSRSGAENSSIPVDNRFDVFVRLVRMEGIRIWPLIWNQHVYSRELRVDGMQIDIHLNLAERDTTDSPFDKNEDRPNLHQTIAHALPRVVIGQTVFDRARLTLFNYGTDSIQRIVIDTIDVKVSELDIDTSRTGERNHVFFSDDVSFSVSPIHYTSADSLYGFTLGPVFGSSRDSMLAINALYVNPRVSDEAFVHRIRYRLDRYLHRSKGLVVNGIAFRDLFETGAFFAKSLSIDSVFLDVYKDKRVPLDPNKMPPKGVHEAFQSLNGPISLDTIRVLDGEIRYREVKEDGEIPGVITFEELNFEAVDISNDSLSIVENRPVTIKAQTRLFGAGLLKIDFAIPLNAPSFDMTYRGSVGPMPAEHLNDILPNLEGIFIENGAVDSLKFDVAVERGVSNGSITLAYHDLELLFVDKVDRSRNLGDRVKTFILRDLVIDPDNPGSEEESVRVVTTSYTRDGDGFFRFLWRSLSDGLIDSIKR